MAEESRWGTVTAAVSRVLRLRCGAYLQYVSGWMFSSFGLKPALGRLLTPNDDLKPGAHPYAGLSYDYWTRSA